MFPIQKIILVYAALWALPAQALSLQQILRYGLQQDPIVLEAQAQAAAAQSEVKTAKAGHLPTLSLVGTQVLAQEHRYESNNRRNGINPGLRASVNVYAWGGIEARVREREFHRDYYQHKIGETQENLGGDMGKLYLAALRAQELSQVAQNNLARHNRMIDDLSIITRYDKGRRSEYEQAVARQLNVQAYLAVQQRELALDLARLSKYTPSPVLPADLQDPFETETLHSLQRFAREDLAQLPSYQAQQAERNRAQAEITVNQSSHLPSVNLMAYADRNDKEVYLNLSWDFFKPTATYEVERSAYALAAAENRLDQIARDSAEQARVAQVDMRESLQRWHIAQQQIAAQQKVVKAYELQFKIARRTLIDVLDAYAELANIELTAVGARNDFRDAALNYLVSQAALAKWANPSE